MLHQNHHQERDLDSIDTPIKKAKSIEIAQPKTAESEQKQLKTIQDIQAQQLFEKFDEIIKITDDNNEVEEIQSLEIERKLDYEDTTSIKLNFELGSSMKKKNITKVVECQNEKLKGMNLFQVECQQKEVSPSIIKKQIRYQTPQRKEKENKCKGDSTPRKKHPYRDITRKNM